MAEQGTSNPISHIGSENTPARARGAARPSRGAVGENDSEPLTTLWLDCGPCGKAEKVPGLLPSILPKVYWV